MSLEEPLRPLSFVLQVPAALFFKGGERLDMTDEGSRLLLCVLDDDAQSG